MELRYRKCAGLDVHASTVVACARMVDEHGHVQHEVRTFGTVTAELLALAAWLEDHGCTHVVLESTGVYWKPVWHVLEGSVALILANAMHVRNIPGRKSDVQDAVWLADLLAHDLIRSSFVPPAPVQALRDLTRTRKQLVREIVQHTQRIQKVLEDANLKLTGIISDLLGLSGRALLRALIAGETGRRASMLTAAYYMLRDDVPYRDLGADHFNRRDKAKLTRRLVRRLQDLGLHVEVRPAA